MEKNKNQRIAVSQNLLKFIYKLKINKKIQFKNKIFYNKSLTIISDVINQKLIIYKGFKFKSLNINKYLVGYKLGNFCFTRKLFKFESKVKTKKNYCKR